MEPEPGSEKPQTSQESDAAAAHALFAATAQIGLAMRESQDPVAELGGLLSHLSETLKALYTAPLDPAADPVAGAATRGLLEQVQSDVFRGIQQLQFYDRMVQHLSHVQAYLIGVANELDSVLPEKHQQRVWDELHGKLRRRLISEEQRDLLDMFLAPHASTRVSAQIKRLDHAAPGSMELF
jgi:hypothetical protein